MNKKFIFVRFIILFLIVFLFYECENGPTAINYGEPFISAELRKEEMREGISTRVEVEGTRLIPIVVINGDTLELSSCDPEGEYMWRSYFVDEVSVDPDKEYELIVSHNRGEAYGTVKLPGDFEITSPKEEDTLYSNEDLTFSWSQSKESERYKLEINLFYYYGDTVNPSYNRFYLDTILSNPDTIITIENEKIFSPEIDSIQEGHGRVYLYSENGPPSGISVEGNISGEGIGYFSAYIYRRVQFVIEDASNRGRQYE